MTKEGQPLEIEKLIGPLEQKGLIEPITGSKDDHALLKTFRRARREELAGEEIARVLDKKLSPEGKERLNEIAEGQGLDLTNPRGLSLALKTASRPEIPQEIVSGEIVSPTTKLRKALKEGPPGLMDGQVLKHLTTSLEGTDAGKVPLKAWLLNPKAAADLLGAIAGEAKAQAEVKKAISQTSRWLVEMAGDDAKRDLFLNYTQNLEEALSRFVKPFCQERNLPIPEEGTLGRMALLFGINSEMVAMPTQAREIARRGEELVKERVRIQAETGRNRMLTKVLPDKVESTKEVNVWKEALINEIARSSIARIASAVSGSAIGAVGGTLAGIENSVSTLMKEHPKVAYSLGAGVVTFSAQVLVHSGPLSAEAYQAYFVNGAVVGTASAVLTGIVSGLNSRFREGRVEEQRQ